MQSEWRGEQEHLKESRALRAATRASRAESKTSLSRGKQAASDVRCQLTKAMVAIVQSYAILAAIEKILAHKAQFAAPIERQEHKVVAGRPVLSVSCLSERVALG